MRRLTVRREALAELTSDDLLAVAGGQITEPNCKLPTSPLNSCLCPTYLPPPTGMC